MNHNDSEDESVAESNLSAKASLMGSKKNKIMQEPAFLQQIDLLATNSQFNPVAIQSRQIDEKLMTSTSVISIDDELKYLRPPKVINGDKTESAQEEQRRKQMRKDCSAAKFETEDSKKYLKQMTFDVPLDNLYSLVDTCHSNRFCEFAPVVFKVECQNFIEAYCTVNNQKYDYLLQVWTKFGQLYFERKLKQKPSYWSVSGKVLLFKEEDDSNILYALQLSTTSRAVLHKFTLPLDDMLANQEFSGDKLMKKDFVFGYEPGHHLLVSLGHKIYFYSKVNEIHGRNKDMQQDSLVFPDINQHKVKVNENASKYYQSMEFGRWDFECDIGPDYRQLGFQELNAKQTSKSKNSVLMLILEHKQKHILQFTRIAIRRSENGKNIVSFKLMGTRAQNNLEIQDTGTSEIKAWKSFVTCNEKNDPYHLAVVLREDGQTDFYYDFNLVELNLMPKQVEPQKEEEDFIEKSKQLLTMQFHSVDQKDTEDEKRLKITDIAFDFDHIYLRTEPNLQGEANFIRMRTSWCQRIGLNASSGIDKKERINDKVIDRKWKRINSRLIQSYVRLHTSFVSFEKYFLLAHRTFVSIYDVSSKVWDHLIYEDAVRYLGIVEQEVHQNAGEKEKDRLKSLDKYSERYEVLVVVGSNEIRYLQFKGEGHSHHHVTQQNPDQKDRTKRVEEFFIRNVYKDQIYFSGVFLLLKKSKGSKKIFYSPDEDKLNTFVKQSGFLTFSKDTHYQLRYFSQNGEYTLLDQPPKANSEVKQPKSSPSKAVTQSEIVTQKNEPEDQSDFLSDKCSFVNYIDFDKSTKKKKHRIMIYNPEHGIFQAFALNIAKDKKDAPIKQNQAWALRNLKPARVIQDISIAKTDFSFNFSSTGIKDKERDKQLIGVYKHDARNQSFEDKMVIATEMHFFVFDGNELRFMYESKNNALRQADNNYIYAIQNNQRNITMKDMKSGEEQVDRHYTTSGLYLIQLSQLMNGVYESYKLQSAIAGKNRELSFSNYSQRMVYIHDYSRASIVPYVHRNTVNLMGVSQKDQYQIWREKSGFFSALNNDGEIQTWSLATGQQLYKYKPNDEPMCLHDYEVFKANPNDNSYQGDQYNFDECSRSLLISKKPKSNQAEKFKDAIEKITVTAGFEIERNEPPINTYDFVLLEMTGHLDKEFDAHQEKDNEENGGDQQKQLQDHDEQIRVALKFEFKILENEKDEKLKEQYWDINLKPTQHIYISKNKQKLLEIVNHKQAYLYKSKPLKNGSDNEVQWEPYLTLKRFPTLLQGDATVHSLFSHDFTYYFDFDFKSNQLVIMDTDNQVPFYRIETDMVNFNVPFTKIKQEQRIAEVGKNICFYKCAKENVIQIITKDELNCLFEIEPKEDTSNKTPEDRHMVLISYVKIDNYDLLDDNPHNILECISPFEGKTINRLIRKAQNYKTQTLHQQNYKNYVSKKEMTNLSSIDYYDKIYTMDYFYRSKNNPVFVSELSFSILNWRMAERIIHEDSFDVNMIQTASQLELLFCIFPKSQTIMHKLCDNKSPENSEDMVKILQRLFQTAKGGINESSSNFFNQALTIPFIKDKDGNTPIDLALASAHQEDQTLREQETTEERGNGNDEEELSKEETEENYTDFEIASVYLNYLKDAPFLNQGELIVDSLINCIENEVEGVADYLEKRFIKTQSIPGKIQNQLKPEISDEINELYYGIISSDPVASIKTMQEKMYLPDKVNKRNQQYDNYFFDIPMIQQGTKGKEFISALAQTSQESIKLFSNKSIQMIINYQWKQWKIVIYAIKIIPYFFLLLVYCFWSNRILTKSHKDDIAELRNITTDLMPTDFNHTYYNLDLAIEELIKANLTSDELLDAYNKYSSAARYRIADNTLAGILIFWASWFMITEIDALIQDWRAYIKENFIENLFDLTPLILLYINTIWSICDPGHIQQTFWIIQSLLSILLWVKFVWFLRSQQFFAYLVRSLVEAVKDIRAFFFILMVACLGFADAFLSLSRSMGDDAFLKGYYQAFKYAWLFCIGSADSIQNANYYADILVFIASITLIIIMLNVLIAIAGQSLESASSLKVEYAYRAKVELLHELMRHPFIRLFEACSKKTDDSVETANDLLFVSFAQIPQEEHTGGQETSQDKQVETIN